MNSQLQEELQNAFNEELSTVSSVGGIIEDYFGEELVDVQTPAFDDVVQRTLNLTIAELVSPIRMTDEGIDFENSEGGVVRITQQEYSDNRNKHILSDDIDPIYVPLVLHSAKSKIAHFLHNMFIPVIIRFPRVRVTNENDKYIDITELYARVRIRIDGRLREFFTLLRAEYDMAQWLSHYSHSHMPSTDFTWQEPCLGSGPIRSTQYTLQERCDMNLWGLFCYELSKYVTVESIAGVPYRRLESVGTGGNMNLNYTTYNQFNPFTYFDSRMRSLRDAFIRHFIREFNFPLSYVNGAYVLGDSLLNFVRGATDLFASWYNKEFFLGHYPYNLNELKRTNFLVEAVVSNGQICRRRDETSVHQVENLQGNFLFMFKGREVTINFIEGYIDDSSNTVMLLSPEVISFILTKILRIINYKYGKLQHNSNSNSQEEPPVNEKCFFI